MVSPVGARVARSRRSAPLTSPIYWAVLGLVIERPSYAYELAHRFERMHEGALSISSTSHVYVALRALEDRGFADVSVETRGSAQPRRRWEATPLGISEHANWVVSQVQDERRRQRVLIAQLGALAQNPTEALAALDAYEEACVREIADAPPAGADEGPGTTRLVARLTAEETRLTLAARLRWLQYARAQLLSLAESREPSD